MEDLVPDVVEFEKASEVKREVLADKLVGLSRVSVRTLVKRALTSGERITGAYLTRMKKELIEKEAAGRLEFLETDRTLDDVAGHDEAKAWLRSDAVLLKRGRTQAIPMGYLLTGRIGTGKTYLVECLSGRDRHPLRRDEELPREVGGGHRGQPREGLLDPPCARAR